MHLYIISYIAIKETCMDIGKGHYVGIYIGKTDHKTITYR